MRLKPTEKPKFPKRTQFAIYRRTCLASMDSPIQQAAANAQDDANDVRYPVVDVGTAVKAGLNEFNSAAIYARADEDWWEPEAARVSEREGECGEGYEVHKLVAALRRWGRRL